MRPASTTHAHLLEEVGLVAMCRALDDCEDLDNFVARCRDYLQHGAFTPTQYADKEAVRRQKIRRALLANKENTMTETTFYYQTLSSANRARQAEWGGDFFSLLYFSNALAGEVGELCNIVKKMERERLGAAGSRATKEELAEEIADVYIYLDLLCTKADIDAQPVITAKFNKTSEKLGLKTRLGNAP